MEPSQGAEGAPPATTPGQMAPGAPGALQHGSPQAAQRGGGLGYKDLRVQGLQQASRVSGEAAERAQYSLYYLLRSEFR